MEFRDSGEESEDGLGWGLSWPEGLIPGGQGEGMWRIESFNVDFCPTSLEALMPCPQERAKIFFTVLQETFPRLVKMV